ncbi:MAG: alpha/beta fold hydrolase, partial [Deltaproteobacteria bacterium]|nr:alpha/beta fold hydrolase [Deltaproteobacteria bacterium]
MKKQTIKITVAGIRYDISICYRPASKDLILFLHGLGCSKDSFRNVWDHNDFKEHSLLSFDLLGFGHSAKPDEFTYSVEDHAKVCEAVVRCFPENRLHIVAHSMGGAIGLLFSDDFLDSVISFVNVEGNLISEDCGRISRKTVSVAYDVFRRELFPDFQSRLETEEHLHFSLDMVSPLAFYRSSQSLVVWSDSGKLLERFRHLKCKKAYFYGEQNARMKVLACLDNIEKRAISKSGHFAMND